ncbi:SDR family oxidoreductase [Breznakia pachnodae]|uniref:Gluconate 5-dehydrogenase n=1 Tax=Breznakia pachnodae TaxID=265178 RepID=A0ABU0E478_9FIRM|nr:SDR family oxidoreductase [Breznakia pachnodae]MDQ0361711.1 gluconate 5-dehydrogenase [Breznakia pachnodae]
MTNMFDLTGKVALVTGGSSGLGQQFARALAAQGASIAIAARRKEKLDDFAKELESKGTKCLAVTCDVTNEQNVIDMVKEVKDTFGRIDILVNNAGTAVNAKAEDQTLDEWSKVIDANLTGVYVVAREVGKVMIDQKYGKIINIGSLHSNTAIHPALEQITAYCSSKGGVQMLTKALAAEWAQHNITVNAIGPAYFASEMTQAAASNDAFLQFVGGRCPMGRMGKEGELDGVLLLFASDASSYITGQLLNVDGGWNTI